MWKYVNAAIEFKAGRTLQTVLLQTSVIQGAYLLEGQFGTFLPEMFHYWLYCFTELHSSEGSLQTERKCTLRDFEIQ